MRGKILKLIAAVLTFSVLSLAFTIFAFAGNDDSLWQKCTLNLSDPMQWLSGEVKQNVYVDGAPSDSFKLNFDTLSGSGHNDSYQFTTYYWQPFQYMDLSSEGSFRVEFQLQYEGFASAILNGYTQCRRIELMSAFYVSGVTLYDYTINLVNGAATIPLHYEAIKTDGYLQTPISYWSDFEIDPSAYFSISFNIPLNKVYNHSYLYLYIYDFGNIMWLEKPGLEESLKNQGSLNDAQDKLDQLESAVDRPDPDIDVGINSIISKENDLSSVGSILTGSGEFYVFLTSLMVVGVSLGLVGYVLHGKK